MTRFTLAAAALSITLAGCVAEGAGRGGVIDPRNEALSTARQIGCNTSPLSHTVTSPGVEVYRFRCAAGREVTITCRNGSCGAE